MTLLSPTPADATPDALLAAGLSHHGAGRLAEAEAAYRRILSTHPAEAIGSQ